MTSDCTFRPRLAAFHDGELAPAETRAVERHLQTCASCAAELAELRHVSVLFDEFARQPVAQETIARFHEELDASDDSAGSVLRIGGTLTALAASVLIVGAAWLMESPAKPPPGPRVVIIDSAPWERVATTLRVDPLPVDVPGGVGHEPAYADADLANWILRNLSDRMPHASN